MDELTRLWIEWSNLVSVTYALDIQIKNLKEQKSLLDEQIKRMESERSNLFSRQMETFKKLRILERGNDADNN